MIERIDKAIDKITNCTGIILFFCTIFLILSMMTAVYYIGAINRPNLNDAPVSFEYAAYNNNIELDNLANHTDKNEGKIRYRELAMAVYKLFNIGLYTAFYIQS